MSFFGLGGLEIVLIGAIALFVLGPKRLLEGIRDGRKVYADLKRQRDTLQSLITEAIDIEDLKEKIDADGINDAVKSLEDDLKIDKVADDMPRSNSVVDKSVPRDWKISVPPIQVDSELWDAIPDLNISGTDVDATDDVASYLGKKSDPPEAFYAEESAGQTSENRNNEVKS